MDFQMLPIILAPTVNWGLEIAQRVGDPLSLENESAVPFSLSSLYIITKELGHPISIVLE